jgi:hypothetical protein
MLGARQRNPLISLQTHQEKFYSLKARSGSAQLQYEYACLRQKRGPWYWRQFQ